MRYSCCESVLIGKLATLITAAESAGVTFVYAISPGLDIVFSCAADVAALKRKMKQVYIYMLFISYSYLPDFLIVFLILCYVFLMVYFFPLFQVSKLGCKSFAILFDDIDPRLKVPDCNLYKSSAEAQSILTNELFQYLKKPRFLFCPTGKSSTHLNFLCFNAPNCY